MDVLTGKQIQRKRKSCGVSQQRLANLCHVTRNTISRLETGVTDSFELRYRISEVLRNFGSAATFRKNLRVLP